MKLILAGSFIALAVLIGSLGVTVLARTGTGAATFVELVRGQ